jgi:hypothetical protein
LTCRHASRDISSLSARIESGNGTISNSRPVGLSESPAWSGTPAEAPAAAAPASRARGPGARRFGACVRGRRPSESRRPDAARLVDPGHEARDGRRGVQRARVRPPRARAVRRRLHDARSHGAGRRRPAVAFARTRDPGPIALLGHSMRAATAGRRRPAQAAAGARGHRRTGWCLCRYTGSVTSAINSDRLTGSWPGQVRTSIGGGASRPAAGGTGYTAIPAVKLDGRLLSLALGLAKTITRMRRISRATEAANQDACGGSVLLHHAERSRSEFWVRYTKSCSALSRACVGQLQVVAIESWLRQENDSRTLCLDETDYEGHVGEQLAPLCNSIFHASSPCHDAYSVATQNCQFFVLVKLGSISGDDTREQFLLCYQVNHPIRRRDLRKSRIEVVQMDVLYTRVETFDVKDGLREVLIE